MKQAHAHVDPAVRTRHTGAKPRQLCFWRREDALDERVRKVPGHGRRWRWNGEKERQALGEEFSESVWGTCEEKGGKYRDQHDASGTEIWKKSELMRDLCNESTIKEPRRSSDEHCPWSPGVYLTARWKKTHHLRVEEERCPA